MNREMNNVNEQLIDALYGLDVAEDAVCAHGKENKPTDRTELEIVEANISDVRRRVAMLQVRANRRKNNGNGPAPPPEKPRDTPTTGARDHRDDAQPRLTHEDLNHIFEIMPPALAARTKNTIKHMLPEEIDELVEMLNATQPDHMNTWIGTKAAEQALAAIAMKSGQMLFMGQDMENEENEQQRRHTISANLRRDVSETFQRGLKAGDGETHLTSDEVERLFTSNDPEWNTRALATVNEMPHDKLARMVAAIGANTRQQFIDWVATATAEEALTGIVLRLTHTPLGMQNMDDDELARAARETPETALTIQGNDALDHIAQMLNKPDSRRIHMSIVQLPDGSRLVALPANLETEHLAQIVLDQPDSRRIYTSFVELADGSRLMALPANLEPAEVMRIAEQVENTD